MFVRRFIHIKRKICFDEIDDGFSEWVTQLLTRVARGEADTSGDDTDSAERPFNDCIESGEMGRINGQEPGCPEVRLTDLKADHAAKSWLFDKYYNISFVDKNPEGDADADGLIDESDWEHHIIKDIGCLGAAQRVCRGDRTPRWSIESVHRKVPDKRYIALHDSSLT